MPVVNYKPTSPGRRGMSVSDFSEVTRTRPERSLLGGLVKKSGGRSGERDEPMGGFFDIEHESLSSRRSDPIARPAHGRLGAGELTAEPHWSPDQTRHHNFVSSQRFDKATTL